MMSIQANMTLSDFSLQGFRRAWRWLNPQKEESCVKEMIQQLAIKVSDATLPITSLSGGNQQKVVLGKALMTQPQVVFLDEPTRGIDVGAKTDVYHLIGKMAQQGLAVMFSSSELDEVMALADRILVMGRWPHYRRFTAPCGDPRTVNRGFNTSRLIRLESIMNQKYMIYMYLLKARTFIALLLVIAFFSVMVPNFLTASNLLIMTQHVANHWPAGHRHDAGHSHRRH
ncbi:sugar ABC transporter ATP-binding protein [Klebsiella pneumoniae]|nr:sugar ABC transporter ATP-binding protein [Klebsiella pneumoniae]